MDISFESMCRTCMNEEGNMCSVFMIENQFDRNQTYAEMLMACFDVKIYEGDGLPEVICQQCKKQLLIAYSFKQQTERSDATLREITKNPNIEFIKEEIPDNEYDMDALIHVQYNEFNALDETEEKNLSNIKHEVPNFELTEEFLNDDIIVKEDEEDMDDIKNCTSISEPPNKLKLLPVKKTIVKKDEYVSCKECGQRCRTQIELRKHKRGHARNYACELCGKQFRSSHGLGYHLKIHKGIKNYACHFENCNRRFTLKQALEKHLSVHKNEKNHLCSLCGKTYSTYDALYYHLKTHKGERPYLCMHCGKTFKQSCHLKTHSWIHSGIKPHVCKKCGKCYTSGHQLKKHLRKYCNSAAESVPAE